MPILGTMYSMEQQCALDWIFWAEGGYVDDPDDPGGATRFGISLRLLKKMGKLGDIDGDGDIDADDIRRLSSDSASDKACGRSAMSSPP